MSKFESPKRMKKITKNNTIKKNKQSLLDWTVMSTKIDLPVFKQSLLFGNYPPKENTNKSKASFWETRDNERLKSSSKKKVETNKSTFASFEYI